MDNKLVKTQEWRGFKIEIYRLTTPFGGFLSAFVNGQEVKQGPMLSVDMAIETAQIWALTKMSIRCEYCEENYSHRIVAGKRRLCKPCFERHGEWLEKLK